MEIVVIITLSWVAAFGGLVFLTEKTKRDYRRENKEREEERASKIISFHSKWLDRWKRPFVAENISHQVYVFKMEDEDRHRFLVEARSLELHILTPITLPNGVGVEYTLEEFFPVADSE